MGDGDQWLLFTGGMVSLASLALVLYTYRRFPSLRRHPNGLVIWQCGFVAVFSAQFVVVPFIDVEAHRTLSAFLAWLTQFTALGSELIFFCISYDLYHSLRNPFASTQANVGKSRLFVVLVSGVMAFALIALGSDTYGETSFSIVWIRSTEDSTDLNLSKLMFFYVWLVVIYCYALFVIWDTQKKLNSGLSTTLQTRRLVFQRSSFYVLGYSLYWLVPGVLYLFNYIQGSDDEKNSVVLAFEMILASRGLVTLGIWLKINQGDLRDMTTADRETLFDEDVAMNPHLNSALRSEVLFLTTVGIRRGVLSDAIEKGGRTAQQEYVAYPLSLDSDLEAYAAVVKKQEIQNRKRRQSRSAPPRARASTVSASVHDLEMTTTASTSTSLPPDSVLGRQSSVRSTTNPLNFDEEAIDAPLTPPHSADELEAGDPSFPTPSGAEGEYVFHDYSPMVFDELRALVGIRPAEYAASLSTTTKERFSEGASGAFMLWSGDERYIVKTMSRGDFEALRRVLGPYAEHLKRNPHTFLVRFFGLHSLSMYGKTLYFVVMNNVLLTELPVHERFDLKGSWIKRHGEVPRKGRRSTCRACGERFVVGQSTLCVNRPNRGHEPNVVLKDNDMLLRLQLGGNSAFVAEQLKRDASMLAAHGLMDYSLLVGVHRRRFDISPEDDQQSARAVSGRHSSEAMRTADSLDRLPDGGLGAAVVEGPGAYYIGIIDILQEWTWGKRLERFAKVYLKLKDPEGLSCVTPDQYALRFKRRVVDELISPREEECI